MLKLRQHFHHEKAPNKSRDNLHVKYFCTFLNVNISHLRCLWGVRRFSLKSFFASHWWSTSGGKAQPVSALAVCSAEAAALSLGSSLSKVLVRFAAQTYFCCLPPPHPSNHHPFPPFLPHRPLSSLFSLRCRCFGSVFSYCRSSAHRPAPTKTPPC